jgi:hypothetical protein
MMAQLGHMDRETSLEYVHVQNRALDRAKQLIESEQEEILAAAQTASAENEHRLKPKLLESEGSILIICRLCTLADPAPESERADQFS